MKKGAIWIIGVLLVLVLAGIGFAFFYLKGKKTEIEEYGVKEVGISEVSIDGNSITYMGFIVLNTSLPAAISPDKVSIYSTFDKTYRKKSHLIKPKKTDGELDTLYYKTSFGKKEFLKEVKRRQISDSSHVETVIEIKGGIPMRDDSKPLIMRISSKVKHFKYPEIKPGKLKLKKLGLKHIDLILPVRIVNEGDYRMKVKNIYSKAKFGLDFDAEVREEPDINLGPGQSREYELNIKVDVHKPGKVISKIISDKDTYEADIYSRWAIEIDPVKGSKQTFPIGKGQKFPIEIQQKDTIEIKK